MTSLFSRAAQTVRQAFVQDKNATAHLERTYVQVALNSSFGGI